MLGVQQVEPLVFRAQVFLEFGPFAEPSSVWAGSCTLLTHIALVAPVSINPAILSWPPLSWRGVTVSDSDGCLSGLISVALR